MELSELTALTNYGTRVKIYSMYNDEGIIFEGTAREFYGDNEAANYLHDQEYYVEDIHVVDGVLTIMVS